MTDLVAARNSGELAAIQGEKGVEPANAAAASQAGAVATAKLPRQAVLTVKQTDVALDTQTAAALAAAHGENAARELGDLSENGDYHAAKEEQGKMEGRIAHLAQMLENAEIVEGAGGDAVEPGCVVELRYEGDDEVERYFVGSIEERRDDAAVVSPGSPLGQALLGRKVGDTVAYEAPTGQLQGQIVSAA